jgi:hypothetical protein
MTNAGNSFENDGLPLSFQHRRVRERELWLAMQEAHKRWTHATEVLNSLTFSVAGEEASPEESVRIAKAAEEQRLGFEQYIEARLEFSEFLLAREPEAGTGPEPGEESRRRPLAFAHNWWSSASTWKRGLVALAIALLCPAVFGLTFMHERKHVRELEAARDAMGAMMVQVRSQAPERKPEEAPSAPITVAKLYQPPAPAPVRAPVRYRTVEFRLAASPRYSAVGPVRVSMRNVDSKHDCFDISVRMGDFRLDRKRVNRYEPVWVNLGGGAAPIRLIADRIGKNGVHGYLSRPQPVSTHAKSVPGKDSTAILRAARP